MWLSMKLRRGTFWTGPRGFGRPEAKRSVLEPASNVFGPWNRGAWTSEDMLEESTTGFFSCWLLSAARQRTDMRGKIHSARYTIALLPRKFSMDWGKYGQKPLKCQE